MLDNHIQRENGALFRTAPLIPPSWPWLPVNEGQTLGALYHS